MNTFISHWWQNKTVQEQADLASSSVMTLGLLMHGATIYVISLLVS